MKCEKHPRYLGMKPTKRDCSACKAIFKKRQETERSKGGLHPSITTPGQVFGINHILAEISCTMLYGKQPPYFWRKDSSSTKEAKEHYKKILLMTKQMKFKKYDAPIFGNNPIESFQKLIWYVAGRFDTDEKMRQHHGKKVVSKEEIMEKEEQAAQEQSGETFFRPVRENKPSKKGKFQNLKKLGGQDGGKKED